MRPGLKVLQLTGSYYGYSVTIVGWVRRVGGDEYEIMPGARVAFRTGEAKGIDRLASEGPAKNYRLLPASTAPEEINRLLIRRCMRADVTVWAKDCPQPYGWSEIE